MDRSASHYQNPGSFPIHIAVELAIVWLGSTPTRFMETMSEVLHPDFDLQHNLRGVFDGRYKLVRYFALDGYNVPQDVEALLADNNVALYDLQNDPEERDNLANPDHPRYDEELLAAMNAKLNALIRTEIGTDKALVKRPLLTIIGSTISAKLRARF